MLMRFAARMSVRKLCMLRMMVDRRRFRRAVRFAAMDGCLIKMVGVDLLLTVNPGREDRDSADGY